MLKLIKTTHNGNECYKDKNKLFMVVKENNGYRLLKAEQNNPEWVNNLKCWAYEEMYSYIFKTQKEVLKEMRLELEMGKWDEFQDQLVKEYLLDIR